MNYEQKYKEAREIAGKYWNSPRTCVDINVLTELFPELKEDEDERMVKIIEDIICTNESQNLLKTKYNMELTDIADWLEKQKPIEWSEEDKKILELTLINLTELKDRFGENYK